jgi:hypothetical protein
LRNKRLSKKEFVKLPEQNHIAIVDKEINFVHYEKQRLLLITQKVVLPDENAIDFLKFDGFYS